MGVSCEKFSFTKITSVASQEVNLSGAFQPKALILWTNGATGTAFQEHYNMSFGFSDGTNDAVVASQSEDNATSATYKNIIRNDAIVLLYLDSDQSEVSRANVTSFDADGFTLNWTINGGSNPAAIIHGIAIGGTDITNVKVEFDTADVTATGNRAYTGAGFQADFMLQIADWDSYNVTSTTSNNVIIGCAKSTTKRWAIDGNTEGATNMDNWAYHRDNKCMAMLSQTGAVDEEADFVSFDSDGYTLNWTNAPGFTTDAMATLLIKGGQWDCGTVVQRDNTGSQAITTAGIDTHKGAFFVTHGQVISTAGTAQAHHRLSVGGADGTRQGYTTYHDTDGVGTAVISKTQNTNGILRAMTAAATASSSTTQAQADFTSFSANTITINWSVADTTDRAVSWWALGEATAGTTFERSPSAENVSVSDASTTRILTANRVPSADSITVTTGTATRATQAFRTVSPDTTTVADSSVTGVKTLTRVPTAEDVTVADSSTTRMLSTVRVPSTEVTTVGENVTRNTQAFRTVSPDTVTPADVSTTQIITRVRAPTADNVTAEDSSLTRMLSATRVPSVETVTPSDSSLTRMLSASRSPSSDSVTVNENVSGGKLFERIVSADSITVADSSLTRLLSAHRLPSADDITTGENLTRILSAIRSPSSDSVTAQDSSTTQMITRVRLPTEETTTISDSSLTRILSAVRSPSTDSVTIVDSSLTRILSLLRIPSSDSITVSENIDSLYTQGNQNFERSPTADSITVSDASLTRLLSQLRVPSTEVVSITDSSLTRILSAVRLPSTETVTTSEDIDVLVTNPGQFNRSPVAENVTVGENLTRTLQLFRILSADSITVGENLTGGKLVERVVSADTVNVIEQSLTRIKSLTRNVIEDTSDIVEASLTRLLSAIRIISPETVTIGELQTAIASYSRSIEDTIVVTEPTLERLLTAVREVTTDSVDIADQIFAQTYHKFLFDSVTVAEQLFIERQALGGSMSYATPAEVRPLLGNLGTQRTDTQITLAIDSAYDEINRKTNRQPPNDWKDTENDFGIVKKICRFKAALEMAIGIKDFQDREWMQKEIDEMFMIIEQHDVGGTLSNDMVISSDDETYALNPNGLIWSTRYKNLRKSSSGTEGSTTIPSD